MVGKRFVAWQVWTRRVGEPPEAVSPVMTIFPQPKGRAALGMTTVAVELSLRPGGGNFAILLEN